MTQRIRSVKLSDQVTLPYAEQGDASGVAVVLLHAIADSWHSFARVLPHLPPTLHVFAPTQRGHGDATRPPTGYATRDFATDLEAFMDALDIERAIIVGGSSGGFAARRFALDHPERTLGLVLLGSPATLRNKPAVQTTWLPVFSALTDPIDPEFVRAFVMGTLAQPVPHSFLDLMIRENLKVPARVWRETFAGLLGDDTFDQLRLIRSPTLIIWGDCDAVLPREDQEALATTIPEAQLVVYSDAGHAVHWEAPERVASDLVKFVRALSSPGC